MAAVETPQDEIEQLREDLAEHATHLDLLQQNADSQRTNWAADPSRQSTPARQKVRGSCLAVDALPLKR